MNKAKNKHDNPNVHIAREYIQTWVIPNPLAEFALCQDPDVSPNLPPRKLVSHCIDSCL